MRYRLPDGCAGVTHDGGQLTVTPDGTVEADAVVAPELAPHGIVPTKADDSLPKRQSAATGRPAVKT